MELKLKGTYQLLIYAVEVNLLGVIINTIKKTANTLTDASKEVGLKVNAKKTKHKFFSLQQNAGQYHNIKRVNRCFENVPQLKYLEL
jgi:hypothetical protein